jgi:hypothetical protein
MAMEIYVVIKQFEDEAPEISCAYQTKETAQKHVDDIYAACQGQPLYKYYVKQTLVIKL